MFIKKNYSFKIHFKSFISIIIIINYEIIKLIIFLQTIILIQIYNTLSHSDQPAASFVQEHPLQ